MLVNRVETALVNSAPRYCRTAGCWKLGCGPGYGTQLILERFGADRVDAVDLDQAMIARVGRRLARFGERVRLAQGSATDLRHAVDAEDDAYDAVFDFAIIHHIPDWRSALDEVVRVLKPGASKLATPRRRSGTTEAGCTTGLRWDYQYQALPRRPS
ncbi:MAG: class I SAM-dependent methyltransferase [Pseudonocardiaceae bacterium]